jgi:hypothetical protein
VLTRGREHAFRERLISEMLDGSAHPNVHETSRALMELYRQLGKADMVDR